MSEQHQDLPFRERFRAWLTHHAFSLAASLGRLLHRPIASLLTITVMALALALPLALGLAVQNGARLQDSVQAAQEITVFLAPGTHDTQIQTLIDTLRARADVASVSRTTPAQALVQLRQQPDLAAAIDALGEPAARAALPDVLQIIPQADAQALVATLGRQPIVERVQYDALWRQRLHAWLALAERVTQALALLLAVGALLVVGNTVRLDIQAHRDEIAILQLLGASHGFVRRPFLYLGLWYGLTADALALAIVGALINALQPAVAALATSYGSQFRLSGLSPESILATLGGAALLGWLGAALAVGQHLREHRPLED